MSSIVIHITLVVQNKRAEWLSVKFSDFLFSHVTPSSPTFKGILDGDEASRSNESKARATYA